MKDNNNDLGCLKYVIGIIFIIGIVFFLTMDNDDYTPFYDHSITYIIGFFCAGIVILYVLINYDKF